ncbi:Sir2 family NAD-dependent protein deacetylase [Erysipelothrix urinaevulpis]|uniref:SIR2 family NAD-dependent protein deacylase n=1 Tax=Erysipelothrix urinaevulpis TaxID=2683717 RepID=UPI001357EEFE|nr:Sir2 family NAD-dependent protein deacetylase [Erysipelothrix urinaevulpis]
MILAFTGAGISKESGISTFMERPDVRDRLHRQFALEYPEVYRETIKTLSEDIRVKEPNDAHYALSDYNIPIITMNIDRLHEKAGSSPILLHGELPSVDEYEYAELLYNKPVLYGDPAPNYHKAYEKVMELKENDTFLIVGASHFTGIAVDLREIARSQGATIIEIQENASQNVRRILEKLNEVK